jgi:hypothetical protein
MFMPPSVLKLGVLVPEPVVGVPIRIVLVEREPVMVRDTPPPPPPNERPAGLVPKEVSLACVIADNILM